MQTIVGSSWKVISTLVENTGFMGGGISAHNMYIHFVRHQTNSITAAREDEDIAVFDQNSAWALAGGMALEQCTLSHVWLY